jgi:dephospho-CoA kinase
VRLVGLTGGIGAGKSTAADLLRAKGARVIDADQISRSVVEPGQATLAALAERFGPDIITADGRLDRQALADAAFASEDGRAALGDITWPAIAAEFTRQIAAAPDDAVVVCDVALLLESAWARNRPYGAIVVVVAPVDVRLERLVGRGVERVDAEQRMAAQATDDERLAIATHVLDNSGGPDALARQVDALWPELLALDHAVLPGGNDQE